MDAREAPPGGGAMTQMDLDAISVARERSGDCRWLSATMFSGQVVEGFRILGRCTLLGRDAYEDDCRGCPHREARP